MQSESSVGWHTNHSQQVVLRLVSLDYDCLPIALEPAATTALPLCAA